MMATIRSSPITPGPGNRAGQIHYQLDPRHEWYRDPENSVFSNENDGKLAPESVQDRLKDREIRDVIDRAMRRLERKGNK